MRTFRLLGMALITILVSVNFASCGSDDDEVTKDDDGIITNQKKLTELKMTDEDGDVITKYSYDSNGKLLSATHTESYSNTYTITWGANTIIESRNGKATTYTFENGLITAVRNPNNGGDLANTTFTYNSNKQLIKVQDVDDYGTYTQSYTWQGEKMTKLILTETGDYGNDESVYEYTYSGKTCKGYLPIMVWNVDDLRPLLEAHPELIGMRVTQLPSQTNSKDDYKESKGEFAYTFDKDGYVESCTIKETETRNGSTESYTTIYTFKWE